jgi:hypothetical protein
MRHAAMENIVVDIKSAVFVLIQSNDEHGEMWIMIVFDIFVGRCGPTNEPEG